MDQNIQAVCSAIIHFWREATTLDLLASNPYISQTQNYSCSLYVYAFYENFRALDQAKFALLEVTYFHQLAF